MSFLAKKMQKGLKPKGGVKMSFKSNFFSSQLKTILA